MDRLSPWMLGFQGPDLPAPVADAIRAGRISGLILFRDNLRGSVAGALDLRREIRALVPRGLPFVLLIDEEGGLISQTGALRLPGGGFWPAVPTPRALGRIGDADLCRRVGRHIGRRLRVLGFQVDLAPSLDLDTAERNPVIGSRSFGRDPVLAATLGSAFARGLAETRVASCFKHYPGHGGTSLDSHLELPRMDPAERELHEAPFRRAVAATVPRAGRERRSGDAEVVPAPFTPWIMTGHIDWGDGLPASVSRGALAPLRRYAPACLRITDALDMKALSLREGGGLRALLAGNDLLLVGRDWESGLAAMDDLAAACARDARVRAAWRRSRERVAPVLAALCRVRRLPFARLPAEEISMLRRAHRLAVRLSNAPDALPEGDWVWIVPSGLAPYTRLEGWKPLRGRRRPCAAVHWIADPADGRALAALARGLERDKRPICLATLFRGTPREEIREAWDPLLRLPGLRLIAHLLDESWPAPRTLRPGRAAGGRPGGDGEPGRVIAATSGPSRESLSGLAEALDLPAVRWRAVDSEGGRWFAPIPD